MKVRQRVYLSVHSNEFLPERISADLGLTADESRLRGSRELGPPPVPRDHMWSLFSGAPDTSTLHDHFAALFGRLSPASEAIRRLAESGKHEVCIQVVRYFDPGPETTQPWPPAPPACLLTSKSSVASTHCSVFIWTANRCRGSAAWV
jgi:hypothetical protein